jgi:DNA-binding transcriptional ArsR family regulator
MDTRPAVNALSALAHEGRLNAFRLLVRAGHQGITPSELARALAMAPNTLSGHLTQLGHAGLVESRREGRAVYYMVSFTHMTELLQFLVEDCCAASSEICAPLGDIALVKCCDDD